MVLPDSFEDREYQKFESTAPGPSVRVTGVSGEIATESTLSDTLVELMAINTDLDVALSTRASEASLVAFNQDVLDIRPPHKIGYTTQHRAFEFTTTQTGTIVWAAVANKFTVITGFYLLASGNTDAVVTLFDETNAAANWLFRGSFDVTNNNPFYVSPTMGTPWVNAAVNQNIRITTSAAITISGVLYGYEADN